MRSVLFLLLLIMITPQQIKAARALLDLSQTDLGKLTGLTQTTIALIEQGNVQPTKKNNDKIEAAFDSEGIEFIEGGVRRKPDELTIIKGADFGSRMMDETFKVLKETGEKEILINALDMTVFDPAHRGEIKTHIKRLAAHKMEQRILIRSNFNLSHLDGPKKSYRILPDELYASMSPCFIYADRFALMLWEKKEIFIIKNKNLANDQRKKFNYLWKQAEKLQDF